MKLSVIVPIFNVEKYIQACAASILNQSYQDFEILFINDGSTDQSIELLRITLNKLTISSSKYKILDKINGGLSDARNYGIKNARGQYLAFIDSDDMIDLYMFEKMMNKIEESDCDVVCCDMFYQDESTLNLKISSAGNFRCSSIRENLDLLKINNSACNKIYKRMLFEDIEFPKGRFYEDLFTIPLILLKAKKVCHLEEPLYYYLQRSNSIVRQLDNRIFDIYDAIYSLEKPVLEAKVEPNQWLRIKQEMYITHGLFLTTLRLKKAETYKLRSKLFRENIEILTKFYKQWDKDRNIQTYPLKTRIIFCLFKYRLYTLSALIFKG